MLGVGWVPDKLPNDVAAATAATAATTISATTTITTTTGFRFGWGAFQEPTH